MSYRKPDDGQRTKAWKAWVHANRERLERIGLPLAVYQDASHWEDFLQNGHLHWHVDGPPFEFGELSREQMEGLQDLIERAADQDVPLLRWLRVRLARTASD